MMGIGVGLIDKGGDILLIASKNKCEQSCASTVARVLKIASIDNINDLPLWQRLC